MDAMMAQTVPHMQEHSVPARRRQTIPPLAKVKKASQRAGMGDGKTEDQHWNAAVTDRLRGLLLDMGWDEKKFADQIHEPLGLSKKAVHQWFNRKSVPPRRLPFIARFLGVDLLYLMIDETALSPRPEQDGRYATQKKILDQARELDELRAIKLKQQA